MNHDNCNIKCIFNRFIGFIYSIWINKVINKANTAIRMYDNKRNSTWKYDTGSNINS